MNDERVIFANDVCKLLVDNHKDIKIAVGYVGVFYDHFFENVRNIYECVERIPLFKYYEFLTQSSDSDYSKDEWVKDMFEDDTLNGELFEQLIINKCEEEYK